MKKLKVAFLAGTLGQGGAERQLFNLLALLKKQDIHVDLYYFVDGFWKESIADLGINLVRIRDTTVLGRLRRLTDYTKRGEYDIIHPQHFWTNLYAVLAGALCSSLSIGSLRSNVFSGIRGLGLVGYLGLRLPWRKPGFLCWRSCC